jgi:hypothetical protein
MLDRRYQDRRFRRLFKVAVTTTQNAFRRIDARPLGPGETPNGAHWTFALWGPRTLSLARAARSSSGNEPPSRATPQALGSSLDSPRSRGEDASHRLLQPTLRHVHPMHRPIPERAGVTRTNRPAECTRRGRKPDGHTYRTAPDHVSAIRPRVSARLTSRVQRWPSRSRRRPRHF